MVLPTPPPYTNPIPNNPFYSPLNPYVCGPYFPVAIGAGIDLTTGATVPSLVNEVQNVLTAGPGIALTTFLGVTTITATGGGGGGTGTVTSITAGTGLTGGTITTTGTIALDNTTVTAGSYTSADITVDAQGRITAAANGSGGSVPSATPTVEGIVFGCTDATNFNYGLGDTILSALTTGTLNVAIGAGALNSTDTGTTNVAVGIGSGFTNTSGNQNIAIGAQSLFFNSTGGLNVAVGSLSLQNATGDANTALGNYAGNLVTTGCNNILIGNQAGGAGAGALDTGCDNVVIGNCLSVASSSGSCQLAIGTSTFCWLSGTSTGAIKPGAGIIDCAASTGTAGQVLMSNGSNALCWGAAPSPSAATPTVAGIVKGYINATNTALGCNAAAVLAATGLSNTAIGNCAGFALDDACCNTLVGTSAGCALNFGLGHTIIGTGAGAAVTSSFYSVFVGAEAGASATGSRNVFIGACAGCAQTIGSSNVAIGDGVNVPITTGGCQLAIGYSSAFTCWLTGNNTGAIKPGAGIIDCANSCGTVGQYLWTTGTNRIIWASSSPSDIRDKEVVGPVPTALPVVQQIEPITYRWKERDSDVAQEEIIYGFSAQQLREVDAVLVDSSDPDHLRIHDRKIVPLLVNAIKELSAKVEALEAKLEANG